MKNDIVNQAKASVAAKHKAEKVAKAYTIWQILGSLVIIIVLLAIGAYAGIKINNAINHTIDSQVQQKVEAQIQTLKATENTKTDK